MSNLVKLAPIYLLVLFLSGCLAACPEESNTKSEYPILNPAEARAQIELTPTEKGTTGAPVCDCAKQEPMAPVTEAPVSEAPTSVLENQDAEEIRVSVQPKEKNVKKYKKITVIEEELPLPVAEEVEGQELSEEEAGKENEVERKVEEAEQEPEKSVKKVKVQKGEKSKKSNKQEGNKKAEDKKRSKREAKGKNKGSKSKKSEKKSSRKNKSKK